MNYIKRNRLQKILSLLVAGVLVLQVGFAQTTVSVNVVEAKHIINKNITVILQSTLAIWW